jgi:hypothetical protein
MSHDQLAKTLISTFFPDFLRLAVPDSARRLRLGEASFLDKELYTDWPTGRRRELDLLARVPVEEGAMVLLIHIEIEARARTGMDQRLWGYYMQIRQRHNHLVLPILVNLRGGRPGMGLEVLEEGFEPLPTGAFRYRVLGLSGCRAADWLPRPEPVAWALAALMHPGSWSRAELKVECLRRVRQWEDTDLRKEVLVNWIETYVQFSGEDAAGYQRLLDLEENREIRQMELTWLGRAEARGIKKGRVEGIEKGMEKGVKKGRAQGRAEAVDQMRQVLLRRIEKRFGAVPERVLAKVRRMKTVESLAEMLEELPLLRSADDLLSR